MELGKRLKEVRLALGLSQRELCGDEITRNMLSQIENGSAKPSMDTLKYLAARLGKPVSYFLEEETVTSPNQDVMHRAREAYRMGDWRLVLAMLEDYRGHSLLVFASNWSIDFTKKRNPGLELSETLQN